MATSTIVAARLPESLATALVARAYRNRTTVSQEVRTILTEKLAGQTHGEPKAAA